MSTTVHHKLSHVKQFLRNFVDNAVIYLIFGIMPGKNTEGVYMSPGSLGRVARWRLAKAGEGGGSTKLSLNNPDYATLRENEGALATEAFPKCGSLNNKRGCRGRFQTSS
jgi:hypothetical protein